MSHREAPLPSGESPRAAHPGSYRRRDLAALATSRPAGLAIAAAAALIAWQLPGVALFGPTTEAPVHDLRTRSGAPATSHDVLARRLALLNAYIDVGESAVGGDVVPVVRGVDDGVTEFLLDDVMAELLGKQGRVRVSHVLDYTSEIIARPRLRTRDGFFAAVDALNDALDHRGSGYYVFASLQWHDKSKKFERIAFDVYAIDGVQRYRSGERIIAALRVHLPESSGRPGQAHDHRLGFTSAGHPDALVVPARVDHELRMGLIPALEPEGSTLLFQVSAGNSESPWYRRLRQTVARVLRDDLAAMSGSWSGDFSASREALIRAVELHEIQHLLDFGHERRERARHEAGDRSGLPPLDGPFQRLAEYTGKEDLAREGFHETSAHLAQMARDPATSRITLAVVTSYAFSSDCTHGDCYAALAILDELAIELGHQSTPTLTGDDFYLVSDLAEFYTVLAHHSRDELSQAARTTWERLFHRPLAPVTAI